MTPATDSPPRAKLKPVHPMERWFCPKTQAPPRVSASNRNHCSDGAVSITADVIHQRRLPTRVPVPHPPRPKTTAKLLRPPSALSCQTRALTKRFRLRRRFHSHEPY